jgi:ankyrin repeat protein
VKAIADFRTEGDEAVVTRLQGTFWDAEEEPSFSAKVLDYLLRSHALGLEHPAPLPPGIDNRLDKAAEWCSSMFGNLAHFATWHELTVPPPGKPLRTFSLLHVAAARGDLKQAQALLDAGVPVDLIGRDGSTPLHCSLIGDNKAVHELLLSRGSPVDVRAVGGVTPLMATVKRKRLDQATFLLDYGADPNAADDHGFTALHRAADLGELDFVRLLLERGAHPSLEAQGYTPRSLAEAKRHEAIVKALSSPSQDSCRE